MNGTLIKNKIGWIVLFENNIELPLLSYNIDWNNCSDDWTFLYNKYKTDFNIVVVDNKEYAMFNNKILRGFRITPIQNKTL